MKQEFEMQEYKVFLVLTISFMLIVWSITSMVIRDGTEYTSSGMTYTDNSSMSGTITFIIGGLVLTLVPIYDAITVIRNRRLPGVNAPKAVFICSLLVLGGMILILGTSVVIPHQTVATIDTNRNSLRFEDRFLSGKTQASTYNLGKIDVIKLDYYDDGEEILVTSMTIVLNDGRKIDSPIKSYLLARKLSGYTGTKLIEEGRRGFDE